MAGEWTNRGRKRAREARAALGLAPAGPVGDLLAVIEERTDAAVLVLDLAEGLAGAYLRPGPPILVVNGNDAVTRQRFTLAHELGHFRMGHEAKVDTAAELYGTQRSQREVEANAFAAEFLMPAAGIAAWGRGRGRRAVGLQEVCELACAHGTSAQATRYQLESAGVLTDRARCDRLDAEIADGLHVELCERLGLEPQADGLTAAREALPRLPAALRDTALGDLLAGACDARGFAQRVHAEPARVDAMLGRLGLDRLLPAGAARAAA